MESLWIVGIALITALLQVSSVFVLRYRNGKMTLPWMYVRPFIWVVIIGIGFVLALFGFDYMGLFAIIGLTVEIVTKIISIRYCHKIDKQNSEN